jgi:hypothetical protein
MIIEPVEKRDTLAALLTTWSDLKEDFSEIIDSPPDDIEL